MSQENVEIVRAVLAANQDPAVVGLAVSGDFDLGWVDPEIEWDASRLGEMLPDLAEVYWGHEGVRTYWRRWFDAWRDLKFDVQDVLDAGDEVVALICNQRQWGRYTGICTELPPYAQVFTLRDGMLVRWRTFPDQDSALKAAGLEEQPRSQNVEIIQRGFERYFATGEPPWDLYDEGVEVYDHDTPDQGAYMGHAGVRRWLEDWGAAWAEWSIDVEQFIDAGDSVVVFIRMRTTGLGSGIRTDREDAQVFTLRDSKVARLDYFNDRKQALKAAGVSE